MFRRRCIGIIQLVPLEVFTLGLATMRPVRQSTVTGSPSRTDLPCSVGDRQWHLSHHDFHHREMFQVIMCLEQRVASVEFHENTPY